MKKILLAVIISLFLPYIAKATGGFYGYTSDPLSYGIPNTEIQFWDDTQSTIIATTTSQIASLGIDTIAGITIQNDSYTYSSAISIMRDDGGSYPGGYDCYYSSSGTNGTTIVSIDLFCKNIADYNDVQQVFNDVGDNLTATSGTININDQDTDSATINSAVNDGFYTIETLADADYYIKAIPNIYYNLQTTSFLGPYNVYNGMSNQNITLYAYTGEPWRITMTPSEQVSSTEFNIYPNTSTTFDFYGCGGANPATWENSFFAAGYGETGTLTEIETGHYQGEMPSIPESVLNHPIGDLYVILENCGDPMTYDIYINLTTTGTTPTTPDNTYVTTTLPLLNTFVNRYSFAFVWISASLLFMSFFGMIYNVFRATKKYTNKNL